jgi:hypothetical protein
MMTLIEDEFYEERVVISRLEQLGFSPSDGRKIFGTYQTMLTADEVQYCGVRGTTALSVEHCSGDNRRDNRC